MTTEQDDLPEPIDLPDPGWVYIDTAEGLAEAVEALSGCTIVGIDTESDSFFSYAEKCCLVQITGNGTKDFIVDPLKIDDLSSLGPMCADPNVVKIFHGADYDVVSMKRDFGVEFTNIFDTMIAAQASGHTRFGLGDLVNRYFGVKLNKKWQRHDWSSRPLRPEHLEYARMDSHFLGALREILLGMCEERGRLEMLQEEFSLLESRTWSRRAFKPDDCMRVKGARGLGAGERRVLRAVYALREGKAADKNRPPFKVWGNDLMLVLAREAPKNLEQLRATLGEGSHVVRRYADEVLAAIQEGLADESTPPENPKPKQSPRSPGVPPTSRDDEPLVQKLKNWRNARSNELKLGPGMIVNNSILSQVAAVKPKTVDDLEIIEEMRRWQRLDSGEALVAVVTDWLENKPAPKPKQEGDAPPRKRRRRGGRRRRRGGSGGEGNGGAEGSAAASSGGTADSGGAPGGAE